jgi:integral membrane protein
MVTADPRRAGIEAALLRYRVMAYIVGAALLVLVLVGVPLQFAAGHPGVVGVVGPIHGFLYIVYLAVGYDLARRDRWTPGRMLVVALAGFVPFLTFVVERRITRAVQSELRAGVVPPET